MGANIVLKIVFLSVQIIYILFGITLIGLGAWVEQQDSEFRSLVPNQEFLFGPYLLIAAGCAVVVVSIIGIVGGLCDTKVTKFLLGFYIVLVALILCAQVAGGILGFVNRSMAEVILRNQMNTTLFEYGTVNSTSTPGWDTVQNRYNCCGIDNATSWTSNRDSIPSLNLTNAYPSSCCFNATEPGCGTIDFINRIRFAGCLRPIQDVVDNNLLITSAIALAGALVEIVVILVALCLLCFSGKDD